jgi:hypothetical protein
MDGLTFGCWTFAWLRLLARAQLLAQLFCQRLSQPFFAPPWRRIALAKPLMTKLLLIWKSVCGELEMTEKSKTDKEYRGKHESDLTNQYRAIRIRAVAGALEHKGRQDTITRRNFSARKNKPESD